MKPRIPLALLALVLFISWRALNIQPFDGDNLWILSWADGAHWSDLPGVSPDVYPEWRPLSYATIWLEYKWAGLDHIWMYQLVNMSIWMACAWLVSQIVMALSRSALAALLGAAVMLTSTQLVSAFVLIVERQNAMACLFGLTAWLMVIAAWDKEPTAYRWVIISLLLAASALSKEFGLAFAGAMAVSGASERRWRLVGASVGATAVYAACRVLLAGGALSAYCEEHGYFFAARVVCFDGVDTLAISQAAYNMTATLVGSFLPGVFFDDGTISISPRWLLISGGLLAMATVGWMRGPRVNRISLLVVAFNAGLNFLIYRPRNQAVAVCALGVATGVGFPLVWSMTARLAPSRLLRVGVVAVLVGALATRAVVMRSLISDRVEMSKQPDACDPDLPGLDRAFMERVWHLYNLQLPGCAGEPPIQ